MYVATCSNHMDREIPIKTGESSKCCARSLLEEFTAARLIRQIWYSCFPSWRFQTQYRINTIGFMRAKKQKYTEWPGLARDDCYVAVLWYLRPSKKTVHYYHQSSTAATTSNILFPERRLDRGYFEDFIPEFQIFAQEMIKLLFWRMTNKRGWSSEMFRISPYKFPSLDNQRLRRFIRKLIWCHSSDKSTPFLLFTSFYGLYMFWATCCSLFITLVDKEPRKVGKWKGC